MSLDNVEDLAIDSNFEVYLDHRGDLATVSGRDAFEQELAIRLKERFNDLIGDTRPGNIMDLLETEARRVADEMNRINRLQNIVVTRDDDIPGKYNASIVYDTGEQFTFEVVQ
jgi:hypothetical protein